MALMDHKTARIEIPLGDDNSFSVRGLDAEDLGVLITNHLEPISRAVQLYSQHSTAAFTNSNFTQLCGVFVTEFPGLVMEVISIAADEPEAKGVKIGLGPQVSALTAIFKLTVEDAAGLGNLLATLSALTKGALQSAREGLPKQNQSRGSIGASEKTSTS